MNVDRPCPHEDFLATVEVVRQTEIEDGPVVGYMAEIRVRCAVCDEAFRWNGVPAGYSNRQTMCSPDETELRAPLRPATEDPDFGMGLPGFAVTVNSPGRIVERRPSAGLDTSRPDDHGIVWP